MQKLHSCQNLLQEDVHHQPFCQRKIIMPKKVTIDPDECIVCQTCVELCPKVFNFNNETDKAKVRDTMTGNEGCIEEAADARPASCIIVERGEERCRPAFRRKCSINSKTGPAAFQGATSIIQIHSPPRKPGDLVSSIRSMTNQGLPSSSSKG